MAKSVAGYGVCLSVVFLVRSFWFPFLFPFNLQILCSFENAFACSIPNQDLPSITTFADLLKIVKTPDQQGHPTSVFPNIKDDGTLPPNLSIQFINTAPKPKPERKPFQNFDAQRPEHATFLSKAERERRKLKGRHLTAAKYKK